MEAPKREPSEPKRAAEPQRFEPRLVEQTERGTLPLALRRDVTRWGPILGGLAATIATAILLSVLGAALGISPAPGQAGVASAITIWGVIVLLVSFFVGGYVAARSAAPGGWVSAVMNSSIVWAVTIVFIVL